MVGLLFMGTVVWCLGIKEQQRTFIAVSLEKTVTRHFWASAILFLLLLLYAG